MLESPKKEKKEKEKETTQVAVRLLSHLVPEVDVGIGLVGGMVEVRATGLSRVEGLVECERTVVAGVIDEISAFDEAKETLRVSLRSGAGDRDRCVVRLFGPGAWAGRSLRVAVGALFCRAVKGEGNSVVARSVCAAEDEVVIAVEAASLKALHPEWPEETATRVAAQKLLALRKRREAAGTWTDVTKATLAMRRDRCFLCGESWENARCSSWPFCAGRKGTTLGESTTGAAAAIELLWRDEALQFCVRTLPAPRGESSLKDDDGIHDRGPRPLDELGEAKRDLRNQLAQGKIRGLREPPESIVLAATTKTQALSDDDDDKDLLEPLPRILRNFLLPFQIEGVLFALRKQRAYIADDMGLGKTLQAVAFAAALRRKHWPLLVICPAGCRAMWADQMEKFVPDLAPSDICVVASSNDAPPPPPAPAPKVLIISFKMLERLRELHAEAGPFSFGVVVVDEAHVLATPTAHVNSSEAQQTTVALNWVRKAPYALLLSGTPAILRPLSMFAALDALLSGGDTTTTKARAISSSKKTLIKKKDWLRSKSSQDRKLEFVRAFCGARKVHNKWRVGIAFDGRFGFHDELHGILRHFCMIRRLKKDVADQLPPLSRSVKRVDLDELHHIDTHHEEKKDDSFHVNGLRKVAAAAQWVLEFLTRDKKRKLVVFAHHVAVLDHLEAALEDKRLRGDDRDPSSLFSDDDDDDDEDDDESSSDDKENNKPRQKKVQRTIEEVLKGATKEKKAQRWPGSPADRIDGAATTASREKSIRRFRSDARCRVVLVSVTAGGVGIDLSAASDAVFVESVGLPASWIRQAEDRLHRRGQRSAVQIFYLLGAPGTWDDRAWPALHAELLSNTTVFNGAQDAESFLVHDVLAAKDDDDDKGGVHEALLMPRDENCSDIKSPAAEVPQRRDDDCSDDDLDDWVWAAAPSKSSCDDGLLDDDDEEAPDEAPERLLFEVSPHTGRIHLFRKDGVRLCESVDSSELEVLRAVARRAEGTTKKKAMAAKAAAQKGLPPTLAQSGRDAEAAWVFSRDWAQLTARQRAALYDVPAKPPLAVAAARALLATSSRQPCLQVAATTRRYVPIHEAVASALNTNDSNLETVLVRVAGREALGLPGLPRVLNRRDGAAKCLTCPNFYQCSREAFEKDCPPLPSMAGLFCSKACREAYKATTSGSGLRDIVFARDAGVCASCGADGHSLVSRLKALKHADYGKKFSFALRSNPLWKHHTGLLRKLIETPRDGLAWEADHVHRVADGGGEAAADAVQTLCVPCHKGKTKNENTKKSKTKIDTDNERRGVAEPAPRRRRVSRRRRREKKEAPAPWKDDDSLFSDDVSNPSARRHAHPSDDDDSVLGDLPSLARPRKRHQTRENNNMLEDKEDQKIATQRRPKHKAPHESDDDSLFNDDPPRKKREPRPPYDSDDDSLFND